MMISGPPMTGKTTLATIYARTLLCAGDPRDGLTTCGECFPCRALAAGPFGDFTFVLPRTKEITVKIVDEDYGGFSSALRLPSHSSRRAILIDSAHTLNEQTGNMMLKLFEEAPDKTVFILVTDRPYEVLPTIRSRCEEVRFTTESAEFIESKLLEAGAGEALAKRVAPLSQGKWVLANWLVSDAELLGAAEKLDGDFLAVLKSGEDRFKFLDSLEDASKALAEKMLEREAEVVLWTLPDKNALDVKDKKSLERWEVSGTRANEVKRMALLTALDWLRSALVRHAETAYKAGGDPYRRLKRLPQALDRAGLWIEQNVADDYVFSALAAKL